MYWGKIIGTVGGLVVGHGLLGGLAGLITGHWIDRYFTQKRKTNGKGHPKSAGNAFFTADRQLIFSRSVVALAAKLSKVDGPVTREEIDAFKAAFRIPDSERTGIAALYGQLKAPCIPLATNAGAHWLPESSIRRPGVIVFEFLPAIPPGLKREEFMKELELRLESACDRLIAEGV